MAEEKRFRWAAPTVGLLALLTLLVFGVGGAVLVLGVQHRDLLPLLLGPKDILLQLTAGALAGMAMGGVAWWLVRRPFLAAVLNRYATLIGPLMPHRGQRLLVSLCAGVGEELFFRGALQYWWGIVPTAVFFVAIHGYLDPRDWRISVYGLVMTLLVIGLGAMADAFGLLAPMLAHTLIDVVLLEGLCATWRRSSGSSPVG